MHRHLTVPNDVATADDSQELIRVFAAAGQLHVTLAWDAHTVDGQVATDG